MRQAFLVSLSWWARYDLRPSSCRKQGFSHPECHPCCFPSAPSPTCHAQYSCSLSNCWNLYLPWPFVRSQTRKSQPHHKHRPSVLETILAHRWFAPRTPLPFSFTSATPVLLLLKQAQPRQSLLGTLSALPRYPPARFLTHLSSLTKHHLSSEALLGCPCAQTCKPVASSFGAGRHDPASFRLLWNPSLEGWLEEVTHSIERGQAEGCHVQRWGWRKPLSSVLTSLLELMESSCHARRCFMDRPKWQGTGGGLRPAN